MKSIPFNHNDSSLIRKKILSIKKIKHLTNNNSTNKSNTTNYTGINNSLSNLGVDTKNKLYFYSPQRIPERTRIKEELINSANNILTQRKYNKSYLSIVPYSLKRTVIKQSKEISLKNYMIDLIKKKRIEIDNRELLINTSLLNSSDKLERDYKNFINSVDNLKSEYKKDEEKLYKIKMMYDNKVKDYYQELNINKKLNEKVIKFIKSISTFKRYGSFLHKVLEVPFPYDSLMELNMRIRNIEEVTDKVIKIYENDKSENIMEKLLENEELLVQKFNYYEEKLMKGLTDKEIIKKEKKLRLIKEKTELNILNQKIKLFQEDLNKLNENKKNILLLTEKYNFINPNNNHSDNNTNINNESSEKNIYEYIGYINEIGKSLGIELPNKINKDMVLFIKNYNLYCKNIMENLGLKEKYVNEYIRKIDNVLENGENDDKELILKALSDIKKENKYKKIISIRKQKEELDNMKRLNAIKRSEKYIIKGRKINIEVPLNKNKKNIQKKIKKKNNDDYEYLYYSSEDN